MHIKITNSILNGYLIIRERERERERERDRRICTVGCHRMDINFLSLSKKYIYLYMYICVYMYTFISSFLGNKITAVEIVTSTFKTTIRILTVVNQNAALLIIV